MGRETNRIAGFRKVEIFQSKEESAFSYGVLDSYETTVCIVDRHSCTMGTVISLEGPETTLSSHPKKVTTAQEFWATHMQAGRRAELCCGCCHAMDNVNSSMSA